MVDDSTEAYRRRGSAPRQTGEFTRHPQHAPDHSRKPPAAVPWSRTSRRRGSCSPLALLAAGVLLVAAVGCDRGPAPRDPNNPAAYSNLTLTRALASEAVVNEVARLEAGGWVIGDSPGGSLVNGGAVATPAGDSFHEQFPPDDARSILETIAVFYSAGELALTPRQIELARDVRQANDRFVAKFRQYLQYDEIDFGLNLREGLLANTGFVAVVRAAHRLEALEAAVLLERGEIDPAVDRLLAILLISSRLDDLPHVVTRLAAAELREEASFVWEAIASHAAADGSTHRRLRDIVEVQLATWAADELAWHGDRAIALHAYEMVRDGQLASLLTESELEELAGGGRLTKAIESIGRNVDRDQEFYLRFMRELIDACRGSYEKRRQVIAALESQLQSLKGTPEYPFLAGEVLLKNVGDGHHRQVADLALWRGLSAAITAEEPRRNLINPLTGEPYLIKRANGNLTLEIHLAPDRIRVISIPVR